MQTHFINIKEVLLQAIADAQHSICVAVAWFSDPDLLAAITAKQEAGVQVRVLVAQTDLLNLDFFKPLIDKGGKVVVAKQDRGIMHIKLTVIDDTIAFMGSYNWTFSASALNKEMLLEVTEPEQVKTQQEHFEDLWIQYSANEEIEGADLFAVLTRLDLVKSYASLGEWGKANEQLKAVMPNSAVFMPEAQGLLLNLSETINKRERTSVLQAVEQIKVMHQQLNQYQSGEEALIKIQIQWFQQQIKTLNELYAEQQEVIRVWDRKLLIYADDLLIKLFALKTELAKIRMEASQKKETKEAYQQAQNEQQAFEDKQIAFHKSEQELDETSEKQLKDLYRKATSLCHPDKADQTSPESIKQATAYMVAVNLAYSSKDIKALQLILEELNNGASLNNSYLTQSPDERLIKLKESLDLLQKEYIAQLEAVQTQCKQPSFINATTCLDFDEWLKGFRQELLTEIQVLEKDIARFR